MLPFQAKVGFEAAPDLRENEIYYKKFRDKCDNGTESYHFGGGMPRIFVLKKSARPQSKYTICIKHGSPTRYHFFINGGVNLESALKEYLATESYFSKGDEFEYEGHTIMVIE